MISKYYNECWKVYMDNNGKIEIQEIFHGYDGDEEYGDIILKGNIKTDMNEVLHKIMDFIKKKWDEIKNEMQV